MAELGDALRARTLWLVCHDQLPDDRLVVGRQEVSVRASPRGRYDRLGNALPSSGEVEHHCSPLRRAVQTATRLSASLKWETQSVITARAYGDWEGRDWDTLRSEDPARCETFFNNPGAASSPGGETLSDVEERAQAYLTSLSNRDDWTDIVAVTHSELIQAAICAVLNVPLNAAPRIRVDALSITRLGRDWMGWHLLSTNHTP
ncbi:MAG: alpha-ribazole phosphatase [Bradymonadia bacterium]|jgi:alpha-ribazole phosphatase